MVLERYAALPEARGECDSPRKENVRSFEDLKTEMIKIT
jgi:hypothetical protein